MHKFRWMTLGAGLLIAAGCNLISGSDGLQIGANLGDGGGSGTDTGAGSGTDTANGSGPGGGTPTGSGNGPTAGSGAAGGSSGSGMGGTPNVPTGFADGAYITDIDLYQAIRRPIVDNGQSASSTIPIVAGRDAMMRVFYNTDTNYNGQPVNARVTLGGSEVELQATLSGSSNQDTLSSTVNIEIPGELLTVGVAFKVELLQPMESVSGTNDDAVYPSGGGTESLDVEQGAVKFKLRLVPVSNNGLPDTSAAQVEKYRRYFAEQYPVPEVEVTVRDQPYVYNGGLGGYNGWADLLDRISDLRNTDNIPDDVYYYGIHVGSNGGLLGLGWVAAANNVRGRTAIGLGHTGDRAPETAVHELGHNHGRSHSPCGVSGDSQYPHSGAKIGVWGYRPHDQKLLNPNSYVDFMSYCDPAWISDWTYKAIFNRAKIVSSQPAIVVPVHLQNRTYDRIRVIDGQASITDTVELTNPPMGEAVTLNATIDGGSVELTGTFLQYNHIDGGVLMVMRPLQPTATTFSNASFSANGQHFSVAR